MTHDNESDRDLLVRIDENVKEMRRTGKDHEARIRKLEAHKHKTIGMSAAVALVVSVIKGWFGGGHA